MAAITLHTEYTGTGIMVTARLHGMTIAYREIGLADMRRWVEDYADRNAAITFDSSISIACDRDTAPADSAHLRALFDSNAALLSIGELA